MSIHTDSVFGQVPADAPGQKSEEALTSRAGSHDFWLHDACEDERKMLFEDGIFEGVKIVEHPQTYAAALDCCVQLLQSPAYKNNEKLLNVLKNLYAVSNKLTDSQKLDFPDALKKTLIDAQHLITNTKITTKITTILPSEQSPLTAARRPAPSTGKTAASSTSSTTAPSPGPSPLAAAIRPPRSTGKTTTSSTSSTTEQSSAQSPLAAAIRPAPSTQRPWVAAKPGSSTGETTTSSTSSTTEKSPSAAAPRFVSVESSAEAKTNKPSIFKKIGKLFRKGETKSQEANLSFTPLTKRNLDSYLQIYKKSLHGGSGDSNVIFLSSSGEIQETKSDGAIQLSFSGKQSRSRIPESPSFDAKGPIRVCKGHPMEKTAVLEAKDLNPAQTAALNEFFRALNNIYDSFPQDSDPWMRGNDALVGYLERNPHLYQS